MSDKVNFNGDVGQAVMGDVKEALRFNNVVTLNMGHEAPPVQTITDFQRSRIAELIKDLAALTGDHTLDIYRIIFTEFGIEKIRELPRDRYKEVVAQIDKWIVDAKDAAQSRKPAPPPLQANESHAATCALCREKDINFQRLQRAARAQLLALLVCLVGCGWLLYKMPDPAAKPVDEGARCYYDGKPYSAGSTIKGSGGTLRECRVDVTGHIAWGKPV